MSRKKEKKKPVPTKRCGVCETRKNGKCAEQKKIAISRTRPACDKFTKRMKVTNSSETAGN